ncbi:MAG: dimethyl sulfoxide reductase subunit B [Coriobacteriaceae bacterium]|nr:dimethyl sulfoxide reductase subunit B [Coriobacteriaceae bacterium]
MTQYGFYFDNSRCTGCRTCELACKDYKDLDQTHAFRRIFDYEGGATTAAEDGTVVSTAYAYHLSMACNHCAEPACLTSCPAAAIEKDSKTGIVKINQDKCKGAKLCIDACPYGVPIFVESVNKANKCDLCSERVAAGLKPICVEACPMRALEFGDIDELRKAHPEAVDAIAPMPADSKTGPSICILKSPAAKDATDTTGAVANEKEVTGVAARKITAA